MGFDEGAFGIAIERIDAADDCLAVGAVGALFRLLGETLARDFIGSGGVRIQYAGAVPGADAGAMPGAFLCRKLLGSCDNFVAGRVVRLTADEARWRFGRAHSGVQASERAAGEGVIAAGDGGNLGVVHDLARLTLGHVSGWVRCRVQVSFFGRLQSLEQPGIGMKCFPEPRPVAGRGRVVGDQNESGIFAFLVEGPFRVGGVLLKPSG